MAQLGAVLLFRVGDANVVEHNHLQTREVANGIDRSVRHGGLFKHRSCDCKASSRGIKGCSLQSQSQSPRTHGSFRVSSMPTGSSSSHKAGASPTSTRQLVQPSNGVQGETDEAAACMRPSCLLRASHPYGLWPLVKYARRGSGRTLCTET